MTGAFEGKRWWSGADAQEREGGTWPAAGSDNWRGKPAELDLA